MTALSTIPEGSRALTLTDDELLPVLQSSLYPGAKDASIKLVLGYCRAAGLDPMQKPVHIVPMRVKKAGGGRDDYEWRDVVMPGIGLYRTQAARTGTYLGVSEPEFGPTRELRAGEHVTEYPEWCRVTVKRGMPGGFVAEFTAVEYWLENYATAGRDTKKPNEMWGRRPRGQLAKCAEAQALRKAFPEFGSQPTADEMEHDFVIDAGTGAPVSAPAPAAPAVARKPKPAPTPVEDATPAAPRAPAPAPAPAADGGEKMVGAGEIAYLRNKSASIEVKLEEVFEDLGLGGVLIEAGKLSKVDFDLVKSELLKRGA